MAQGLCALVTCFSHRAEAVLLTILFCCVILPANLIHGFTHHSLSLGSRSLRTDGSGVIGAFSSASSTCSESRWTDRFSRDRVSPGDMSLGGRGSQPPWCWVWPRAWPHGHREQEVLGISYLKLMTISMSSSKELPNPLNPSCWKHTFQTESIFISILLKQSWLFFPPP